MGLVLYRLSLAVSVALIVHRFRTGRNTLWIMALMFLPVAGAIAYVIVEIPPDLRHTRTLRKATRGVQRTLDPERELRRYQGVASVSGDVASQRRCWHARWKPKGESTRRWPSTKYWPSISRAPKRRCAMHSCYAAPGKRARRSARTRSLADTGRLAPILSSQFH